MSGIEGTIWSGRIREGNILGVYVRNVELNMQPLALLTGKLGYAVEASAASGFVNGNVAIGSGGDVEWTDLTASVSLQALQDTLSMPGLNGTVNLRFEKLAFEDSVPVAVAGTVEITNLRAPLVHRGAIGNFKAEFFTQESGVMASVEDTDAVVDLAGSLSLLPDRTYQFLAQVAPQDDTPADLKEQMRFLGSANERGQYELRLEGQL